MRGTGTWRKNWRWAREIPKLVLKAWPVILSAKGLRVRMICWVQAYRTQEDYHGESSVYVSIHTYREGTTVLSWKGFPLQAVWRLKPQLKTWYFLLAWNLADRSWSNRDHWEIPQKERTWELLGLMFIASGLLIELRILLWDSPFLDKVEGLVNCWY